MNSGESFTKTKSVELITLIIIKDVKKGVTRPHYVKTLLFLVFAQFSRHCVLSGI